MLSRHNYKYYLKDVGYFVNIIALAISEVRYTINLNERNELIQDQKYGKRSRIRKNKDELITSQRMKLQTPIQPILALSCLANQKGEIEEYKTIMISDYSTQADRNNIRMRFINEGEKYRFRYAV